jgi:hypothetical protein
LSFLFLCPFDTFVFRLFGAQLCLVRKRCSCFMAVHQFFLLYRLLESSLSLSPFMPSTQSLVRSADEVEAGLSNLRSHDAVFQYQAAAVAHYQAAAVHDSRSSGSRRRNGAMRKVYCSPWDTPCMRSSSSGGCSSFSRPLAVPLSRVAVRVSNLFLEPLSLADGSV